MPSNAKKIPVGEDVGPLDFKIRSQLVGTIRIENEQLNIRIYEGVNAVVNGVPAPIVDQGNDKFSASLSLTFNNETYTSMDGVLSKNGRHITGQGTLNSANPPAGAADQRVPLQANDWAADGTG